MKLSTPEDSCDLSPCPFCSYGRPVMTIETYLLNWVEKAAIYGRVDCPRCLGHSGPVFKRVSVHIKAEDFDVAVDKVQRDLTNIWNGFARPKNANLLKKESPWKA